MKIVIVGAGNVGRALGGGWRTAGHAVTFAVRDRASSAPVELEQQGFGIVAAQGAGATGNVIVLAVESAAGGGQRSRTACRENRDRHR